MIKFRSRLLFALIMLIIVVLIGLGLLLGQIFKSYYLQSFNHRIEKEAKLVVNEVIGTQEPQSIADEQIEEISNLLDIRVTITGPDGNILKDSGPFAEIDPEVQNEAIYEITEEWNSGLQQTELLKNGNDVVNYWQPIGDGEESSLLILGSRVDILVAGYKQIWAVLSISLGMALVVIIMLGSRITARYTKPIDSATGVAMELAKGNYRARTYEDRMDETSMLSRSINILARNLQEMTSAQEIQQNRLTTLIENMGSGLLLIDHRGYAIMTNRAFKEFFSITSERFVNERYYDVIKFPEVNKLVEEIFMTEQKVRKQLLLPLQIERKHFEVYGAPIIGTKEEWKGIVLVFHDITELKKLEQMRKDFVANVSHELRTPITSIKGFSETLLDGAMNDKETTKAFLNIILNESDRLQSLITDLLDLSKMEKQGFQLHVHKADISVILQEVVAILEKKPEKKEIQLTLHADEPSVAEVDSMRMKQVFINLIGNAITYTPAEGKVTVSVSQTVSTVVIEIKDSGIGIDEEEIPRIFERFYRVDKARSRDSGGTGLGLAIVKHLVEAHGGQIGVESKVNEGTTFKVTLFKKFLQEDSEKE
ncbi:cell wall metabolism sensor histidine kinase WalK [Rossellomorea vietnamensis]|uniref:histidine kinase n=1 Tax=Rossellomorea vietnamensis TaxID=218284 RepID=A0A5D4P0Y8_9BACI|nr:ATP-binding protein [Rossellomorea vietnamensis]TYS19719.1 cell wall metabolism sensor histidine kinase WalK [Rossellomorea vietnamensis]